ncbi:MobF family relaxase [Nocardia sp. NPDC004722]
MTIHALHAGDGYTYLTRQVATGDRTCAADKSFTDYYTATGTPPGRWFGRGAEILGVTGEVSQAQMLALYGEGIHPDADRIIIDAIDAGSPARQALTAASLGSGTHARGQGTTSIQAIYQRDKTALLAELGRPLTQQEWADLRANAARQHLTEELQREPSGIEIEDALADEKRRHARAVAGYDCVFTPQKSVSMLWGLGDDAVRAQIAQCHREAVEETLERMQSEFALARRGAGGVRQIDADGMTFALYDHFDNRTGDPNLHTHAVVSARVLGADGKWCALDARSLYAATVSLSCQYNAAITGKLKRRLGLRFEPRYRNGLGKAPVYEIANVPDDVITHFSRRPNIVRATEKLVADYRAKHGHNPSKAVQIRLAQAATLATRGAKPLPRTLREMIDEWAADTEHFLGDGRTAQQWVGHVLELSHDPNALRDYDAQHVALAAAVVLAAEVGELTDATPGQRAAAVRDVLHRYEFSAESDREAAVAEAELLLDPEHDNNLLDLAGRKAGHVGEEVYDRERLAAEVAETVARRRATWTEVHVRAAAEDRVSACDFASDTEQADAVAEIVNAVLSGSIQLTVDPEPVPKALARNSGHSVFTTCAATTIRYSSHTVLDAENALLDAARTPTPEFVTTTTIAAAVEAVEAETGKALNAGQQRIVRHLCVSGTRLAVAIGPAGTGKTTAMRAVARAWIDEGRKVLALAPQKSSARVLGDDIGVPARTIESLLTRARKTGDAGIEPGTMLLVDEAGMAATANLAELQALADAHGAVVRWIGDPAQLSAVEAGGCLRLVAADTHAPALDTVVRFADPDEAQASLRVRDGDAPGAWEFYHSAGRIVSGMVDELREQILTAHLADLDSGVSSLMMAATLEDVHLLNGAAQAAHAQAGHVDTVGPGTALADQHTAYVGDIVVTRRNTNRIRITGGIRAGDPIDNGEQWRVRKVHADGSLTVGGVTHRGQVVLPARYVADNTELGYASTVHRAQGMTVQHAYVLMGAALGRSLAYVGLTRGSDYNGIFLATDTLPDVDLDHAPAEPRSDYEVWCRELAREDDNITATEVLRRELAAADDPQRLREIYDHARGLLVRDRIDTVLEHALPTSLYRQVVQSPQYETLVETLDRAEQSGLDLATLVGLAATDRWRTTIDPIDATDNPAAVLRSRADRHIARQLGLPTTGTEGKFLAVRDLPAPELAAVPPRFAGIDAELADYTSDLYTRLSELDEPDQAAERVAEISEFADTFAVPDPAELPARLARIRADYEHTAKALGRDWARHELAQHLPARLRRHVEDGPCYEYLLDVVAASHTAGLDPREFITEIIEAAQPPLTRAEAAASVLAARGQAVLEQHQHAPADALRTAPTPLPPRHSGVDHRLAAHAIQLREQLHALENLEGTTELQGDPLRTLDDADLAARIRALRASLNRPDPAPATAPGQTLATVEAEHAELHTQADLVRAALAAQVTADTADMELATATTAFSDAQRKLEAVSAYRIGTRRKTEAERDSAQNELATARTAAQQAREHAEEARVEVIAAGAAPHRWQTILDRDADTTENATNSPPPATPTPAPPTCTPARPKPAPRPPQTWTKHSRNVTAAVISPPPRPPPKSGCAISVPRPQPPSTNLNAARAGPKRPWPPNTISGPRHKAKLPGAMVSARHEAMHRIFQHDPAMFARAFRALALPFPDPTEVTVLPTDLTEHRPPRRHPPADRLRSGRLPADHGGAGPPRPLQAVRLDLLPRPPVREVRPASHPSRRLPRSRDRGVGELDTRCRPATVAQPDHAPAGPRPAQCPRRHRRRNRCRRHPAGSPVRGDASSADSDR